MTPPATSRHQDAAKPDSPVRYLSGHRVFNVLPKGTMVELAAEVVERSYPKGQILFYQGDPASFVFVVRSGLVALTELDERGHVHPILTFSAGDMFGIAAALLGVPRPTTASALSDANVLLIPRTSFDRLYHEVPAFAHQITRELCLMLWRSEQTTFRFTRTPVVSRVAKLLLEKAANAASSRQQALDLTLSHQDLALLLGTSRETITRVLGRLSRKKIIEVHGHRVFIFRPDELRQLAEEWPHSTVSLTSPVKMS